MGTSQRAGAFWAVLCAIAPVLPWVGQDLPAGQLTFEAASVKKSAPPGGGPRVVRAGAREGDSWLADNATLRMLIRAAYSPRFRMEGELAGGPGWIDTDRFDIVARMARGTTAEGARTMAQALLADRFSLRTRIETRDLAVYALAFARRDRSLGPRMRPAGLDCDAPRTVRQLREPPPSAPGRPDEARPCLTTMMLGRVTRLVSGGMTLAQLVANLSPATGRPIIDETGLSGFFAVRLEFATEAVTSPLGVLGPPPPVDLRPVDAPSLFSALQDQLGLKLEPRRRPMGVLVIESAQQPTEN